MRFAPHVVAVVGLCTSVLGVPTHDEGYSCLAEPAKSMAFCDAGLTVSARVTALMLNLSMHEKVSLMGSHGSDICGFDDGGVDRLGIPSYHWCTEDNTGVSTRCLSEGKCVTTWPSPAVMASSFNRSLWRAKGRTQGIEHRTYFNLGGTRGAHPYHHIGLNGWGPNINLVRDPRYGRNSELPTEDPLANGFYAIEVVKGLQNGDDDTWPLLIHATLKHYTAYSVETNRFGFNGNVSDYDLYDSFLPQYRMGFVDGGAGGAMCSYASINGVPSCANSLLLNTLVRKAWGAEDALLVTDCEAVASMYKANHYAKNDADASAKAINAGVDLNTGYPFFQNNGLIDAVGNKTVTLATIDAALSRSLAWKFKLGLFDDPTSQSYTKFDLDDVNTTASQQLVQEAAAQGFVLLRNDDVLPLTAGGNVAVVGPHANSTRGLLSDYVGDQVCFGDYNHGRLKTTDGCIRTFAGSVATANTGGATKVEPGCQVSAALPDNGTAALAAVAWADTVVLCIGIDNSIEHEDKDRVSTTLPDQQLAFARAVLKAAAHRKVVIVLVNGGAIAADDLIGPAGAPAVIEAFYPNQAGAAALGPALFGATNRWGKLPITIYPESYTGELKIQQMQMRSDTATHYPGRGYRYYAGQPTYRFGFGLSLTTFATSCTGTGSVAAAIRLSCTVKNIGGRDGDEVVILFHRPPQSSLAPTRRLIDFARVTVPAGSTASVGFVVTAGQLELTGEDGAQHTVHGTHALEIGLDGQELKYQV